MLPVSAIESAADTALALHDVHFAYPTGAEVLAGVSLSVARGSIVGIVGPSGCGKSTLLSLLAGLARPTAGRVDRRLGGSDRHPMSMVFQKDTVLPWLTVAENALLFTRFKAHGLKRRSTRAQEIDGRVGELLELVGLADRRDAYPYQLSGGMRRRLAFLTAVAPYPQVLMLDEPFSSVDEPTRIGIHQDVFRIARMLNMTTLLITHDLAEAITVCDRVVILSQRPATIASEHTIPFGEDRVMLGLRETAEYQEVYAQLWHDLTEQIAAGQPVRGATNGAGHVR